MVHAVDTHLCLASTAHCLLCWLGIRLLHNAVYAVLYMITGLFRQQLLLRILNC